MGARDTGGPRVDGDGAQGRPEKGKVKQIDRPRGHSPTFRGFARFFESGVPPSAPRSGEIRRLPFSGGDPETVFARIRKSRGVALGHATPANSSIEFSGTTTEELLAAFDRTEKALRVLAEFFGAVETLSGSSVEPLRAFVKSPGERERFRVLTASAVKIYQALAAEPLGRCAGERILGIRFADLGEAIVVAFEVLDYVGGAR